MADEAVVGLECHIQLATASKMFCGCPVEFGAPPNTNVCPVCLGLPGALPVANRGAIDAALKLGLALGCAIRGVSVFARKNYFYPDMPKNYQITQYDQPLCDGGALPVTVGGTERTFDLVRIHVEEDTGKSFHPERHGDRRISRVDFNRAGVPLLELVTQPVFHRPEECGAFLTELRRLVRWLGISEGDMEKGHLRCDANVSVRPAGATTLGTKTELKNLNSIKGVEKGIAAEVARQRAVLAAGGRIEQATLLYDADHDKLAVMRSKEHAHDYRYFPEPDLPLLEVDEAWRARARESMPELPWAMQRRFEGSYGLPAYDAAVLTASREVADYFEAVAREVPAKLASNWVMTELLAHTKTMPFAAVRDRVPPATLARILAALEAGDVTGTSVKEALEDAIVRGGDPAAVLERKAIRSTDALLPIVREVIAEHAGPVGQYLAGKTQTLGFLVGQVMKKSGGQAAAPVVRRLLEDELRARSGAS
jgi:aspartyl-tRNA(Asn)/glutamyl-tRNA(Gln) amidotransferase subunit B